MEKQYKVKVNEEWDYNFNLNALRDFDSKEFSPQKYHILHEQKSFKGEILKSDFLKREYSVKINNTTYRIKISNELDLLIEEMGLSLGTFQPVNDLKAPMPGLILEVNVNAGDEVKAGEYMLVLEAMKMENTLTAPRDGVVKSIMVEKGQSVEKGQLLIEME